MMRKLFRLIFGWPRKYVFPRWLHEEQHGNIKAVVGQDLSADGIPEVIVQLLSRSNYGKWKVIGTVRYLDMPSMKILNQKVDTYLRSLVMHD